MRLRELRLHSRSKRTSVLPRAPLEIRLSGAGRLGLSCPRSTDRTASAGISGQLRALLSLLLLPASLPHANLHCALPGAMYSDSDDDVRPTLLLSSILQHRLNPNRPQASTPQADLPPRWHA